MKNNDSHSLPTVLFIIDRVKHWSSRAWMALNSAVAYRRVGGRVLLLVDCPRFSNPKDGIPRELQMKSDLILERAREAGLMEFSTLPIGRKKPPIFHRSYWRAIHTLARMIDDQRIDVLHHFRRTHHLTVWSASALAKRRVALVRGCARTDRPLDNRFWNRPFYRRLDAVTGFNKTVTERNRKAMGLHHAKCHHIPVALPELFTGTSWSREQGRDFIREHYGIAEGPLVGLIGAMEEQKRCENLIAAAKILRNEFPALKILLVGEHSEAVRADLLQRSREAGLDGKVHVLSYLHREFVPRFMAGLDVGVYLAYRSSGPSRVILEYMSQGLPTIATDVGCVPEYHERDPAAFVMIPKENIPAIGSALGDLLRDNAKREEMSRRSRELINRCFTLGSLGQSLLSLYRSLLPTDSDRRQ
jgi:glycosyltransferase involved in cell wall biosynthesis